jgi:hypothetical protein
MSGEGPAGMRKGVRTLPALALTAGLLLPLSCSLLTSLDAPTAAAEDGGADVTVPPPLDFDASMDATDAADAAVPVDACAVPGACVDSGPLFYAAKYVSQSFPLSSDPAMMMAQGQVLSVNIVLQNSGHTTWDSKVQLATTQPRDRASGFSDSKWITPERLVGVVGTVPPGKTYKFTFDLAAPYSTTSPATYYEYFDLVASHARPDGGDAWFGDPDQGGPPDNDIEAKITVSVDGG